MKREKPLTAKTPKERVGAKPLICGHCYKPIISTDHAKQIGTNWYHAEHCYAEALDRQDFDREI